MLFTNCTVRLTRISGAIGFDVMARAQSIRDGSGSGFRNGQGHGRVCADGEGGASTSDKIADAAGSSKKKEISPARRKAMAQLGQSLGEPPHKKS